MTGELHLSGIRQAWLFEIARAFQVWAGKLRDENEATLRERMSALPRPTTRLEALVLRGLSSELWEHFDRVERWRRIAAQPQVIRKARRYLEAHYAEHVTIASLSRALGCSRAKLTRGFRTSLGTTVHDYLTEVRARHALRALRDSADKVESIALMVGYKSKKDLYRAIRAATGLTPNRLRRKRIMARLKPAPGAVGRRQDD